MATWAIGDIQGCMDELQRLLAAIAFEPARDRLWLVGDLVNRGPRSLDVLRWARGLDHAITCVLGNHDLHLLQRVAGAAGPKKRDTLDDILAAPDRDELVEWLRRRPLVHVEGERVLVHAGLHPSWSVKKARKLAAEVEEGLAAPDWRERIAAHLEAHRETLSYLVRVRCIDANGAPDSEFAEHPKYARRGLRPWFDWPEPAWGDHTVVFGHWAALGLTIGVRHLGVDSACVWGGQLTAVRLDDSFVVQVPHR